MLMLYDIQKCRDSSKEHSISLAGSDSIRILYR